MKAGSLVYVAGYGRSGSTLLDLLASNIEGVRGVGEACNIFDFSEYGGICSCGEPVGDCTHWADVVWSYCRPEALNRQARSAEGVFGYFRFSPANDYAQFWSRFFEREARAGTVVVDSSKLSRATIMRPWILKRYCKELYIVHLYREPDALLSSLLRGSNHALASGASARASRWFLWRSYFGALFANFAALLLPRVLGVPRVFVRFSDLVADPIRTLERIGLQAGALDVNNLRPGHAIGGNRFRKPGVERIVLERGEACGGESCEPAGGFFKMLFSTLLLFASDAPISSQSSGSGASAAPDFESRRSK